MTKKKAVILAVALIVCIVAVFAAACTTEMTTADALAVLTEASSGVAVADVTVTVTDSNGVIYSYPEKVDVPAEIQGVISNFVPDMNGSGAFNYDSFNFTGLAVAQQDNVATLTGQITNMNAFLGTENLSYNGATITATIDTETMRAMTVDVAYTYSGRASNFTIAVNTVYNY